MSKIKDLFKKELATYEPAALTVGRAFVYSAAVSFSAFAFQVLHEPHMHVGRDALVATVLGAGTAGLHAAEAAWKSWRAKSKA